MSREINVADVRRAGRYAWNDATGEFRVYNPDRAHFGFWVRIETDGQAAYAHLDKPALGCEPEARLQTWRHKDGCLCGLCSEAEGEVQRPVLEGQGRAQP
jgi:hypothetical protein